MSEGLPSLVEPTWPTANKTYPIAGRVHRLAALSGEPRARSVAETKPAPQPRQPGAATNADSVTSDSTATGPTPSQRRPGADPGAGERVAVRRSRSR